MGRRERQAIKRKQRQDRLDREDSLLSDLCRAASKLCGHWMALWLKTRQEEWALPLIWPGGYATAETHAVEASFYLEAARRSGIRVIDVRVTETQFILRREVPILPCKIEEAQGPK